MGSVPPVTVDEQPSQADANLPVEGSTGYFGPVERAGPAGPSDLLSRGSQDELASLRDTVARLGAAYPWLDSVDVEATVRTAYESFREARVRAYVPILVERRSRRALQAACRAALCQAVDGRANPGTLGAHPGSERD
ncbi:three-helix bundle dimerization domain-containing protein [Streptomyces sp. NPDC004520]|uniref:three-helix bundle dimerization domain-containing protein n=1 Tax=unclassified Streptomyces TaxID=2593676 RepID=UPI0036AE5F00